MTSRPLIFMWSEEPSTSDLMCDIMLSRGHGGQGRFSLQNLILGQHITSKLVSKESRKWNRPYSQPFVLFCCFCFAQCVCFMILADILVVFFKVDVKSRYEIRSYRIVKGTYICMAWLVSKIVRCATAIACGGKVGCFCSFINC